MKQIEKIEVIVEKGMKDDAILALPLKLHLQIIDKINELIDALTSQEEPPKCKGEGMIEKIPESRIDDNTTEISTEAMKINEIIDYLNEKESMPVRKEVFDNGKVRTNIPEIIEQLKPAKTDKCPRCNDTGVWNGKPCSKCKPDTPSEKDELAETIYQMINNGLDDKDCRFDNGLCLDLAEAIHKYISDKLDGLKENDMKRDDVPGLYCGGYQQAIYDFKQALGLIGGKE